MKIAIGSDHRGFDLKEMFKKSLKTRGIETEDCGARSTDAVDYPDHARNVAMSVSQGSVNAGILICGSGIGMSIAANSAAGERFGLTSDDFDCLCADVLGLLSGVEDMCA